MEVATSKIKKGYKQTEVGVIPEDWNVHPLHEFVVKHNAGVYKNSKLYGTGTNIVGVSDIYGVSCIAGQDFAHVPLTKEEKTKYTLISGDLLYGESSLVREGIARTVYVTKNGEGTAFAWHTRRYSVRGELLDSSYLYYLLQGHIAREHMMSHCIQTALTGINTEAYFSCPILAPEITEQQKIAEAFSDIDSLIQSLDTLIAKKKNIKTATMQQLLSGKTRLAEFSDEWVTAPLGDVVDFFHGRGLPKADLSDGGLQKCIHYGQLFSEYSEQVREVRSRTNKTDNIFVSKSNDVLVPTSDVTPRGLATSSCIKEDGVILGGGILVLRPKADIDGSFVSYFITNNKNVVLKLVKGSTVFHLYASDLSKLELRMPSSVNEQSAIVAVLEEMKSEINSLEKRRDKLISLKQGMIHELLTGNTRLV